MANASDRSGLFRAVWGSSQKKLESVAESITTGGIDTGAPRINEEEVVEQLRQWKAPQEVIDAWLGNTSPESEDPEIPELEVWNDCWISVDVFRRCKQTVAVGFGGAAYLGITATEIVAVCNAFRILRKHRAGVLEDVQFMGDVAARVLSERDKAAMPTRRK